MAKKTDAFANKFYGTVTESDANTLTFAEIQTNIDVFARKAWILHKLEWFLSAAQLNKLLAEDDVLTAALCSSNKAATLSLSDASVIDLFQIDARLVSQAGFELRYSPISRDFSSLPGGGLIIAPRPLFVAVKGTSLASAIAAEVRGYFTAVDLNADEYLELVDFYRIVQ